jgi:hypothetical protein
LRATIAPCSAPTRRPDDQIWAQIALEERTQHPDLCRAEVTAPAEDERNAHPRTITASSTVSVGPPPGTV